MEVIIIGAILMSAMLVYLCYDYIRDKKRKEDLLRDVLNKKVLFNKIWITDPDGDGYQKLLITLVKNGKTKNEVLAGHFDIPNVSEALRESDITYMGSFK